MHRVLGSCRCKQRSLTRFLSFKLLSVKEVIVLVYKVFFTMPPVFTIVGDSNVRRHMTPLSCRAPYMSEAQVSICGRIEALTEVLRQVRTISTAVIVACLTNFITSSPDGSSVSMRSTPVLEEFRDILLDFCQEQPERYRNLTKTSFPWFMLRLKG